MMSFVGFLAVVAGLYFWWCWRRDTARAVVSKPRRHRQWEGPRPSSSVSGSPSRESAPSLALVPASSSLQRLNDTFGFEAFDDTFERGFLEIEYPFERPLQMSAAPFPAFQTAHNLLNETYVIANAGNDDGPLGDPKLNYSFVPFTEKDVLNSTFSVGGAKAISSGDPDWDGEISRCDCTACIFRGWDVARQRLNESDSGEESWSESDSDSSSSSDSEDPCLGIKLAPVGRRVGLRGDFNPSWLKPTKTSKLREALAQKNKKQETARSVKGGKRGAWR